MVIFGDECIVYRVLYIRFDISVAFNLNYGLMDLDHEEEEGGVMGFL